MSDYREAVILAIVGISILSLPTAAGEVMINDNSEDGLIETVTTDMGDMFSFKSSEAERRLTLRDQNTDLTTVETPEKQVVKLQNSEGSLKSVSSANKSFKLVETPYGRLKVGFENGKRIEKFEGQNRSKVEKVKQDLLALLEQKRKTLDRKAQRVVESNTVAVRLKEDFSMPGINLTNTADKEVNLANWKLKSKQSADTYKGSYIFGNITLEPNEKLVIGTHLSNASNPVYDIRTKHIRLYDSGDRLRLTDEWGTTMDDYRYAGD